MNISETQTVFDALSVCNRPVHKGTLALGRNPRRGEHILTRIDSSFLLPPVMKAFINVNPEAALDFFDRLCLDNGGKFPEAALIEKLGLEVAPHAGTIRFDGNRRVAVKLGGSKLIGYGRGAE